MTERLIQHEIHEEMQNSYIDYAMSVIVGRALPDVRDGLKPVHRRILFGLDTLGIRSDKPHKKSARIVGEVMGKYHPHGDSSIYDAMVKMAQPFATRYPLVDGHGNFGSIDGDGAAAQRYTEARMSALSEQMLRDIDKNTVDFIPNFDEEEREPVVLPSRIPNLLVNGSSGIAVGMATSIPPHNLGDTVKAVVKMIDNPDIDINSLIKAIKGPDFPTGAQILGKEGFEEAYRTGQGKLQVRAVSHFEDGSRGRSKIVFTEIPYQVNKAKMLEKMGNLVRNQKLSGIASIRDESSREGMRIVVEVKRESDPQKVLTDLYKLTPLQDTYSMILLALVDGRPKILNLQEIISEYLKHQKVVITRRTQFELEKAEARLHIVEGLRIALDNIDEIIKTIRKSHDDAKERLMKKFKLSEIQAQAILDMRLARLQGLERKKIEEEYKALKKKIKELKALLKNDKLLMGVIKEELLDIKKKWADKRRTVITTGEVDSSNNVEVTEEETQIVFTNKGYLRKISKASRIKKVMKDGDFVRNSFVCSSDDSIMIFTETGQMYKILASEIPANPSSSKGTLAFKLLGIPRQERIVEIMPYTELNKKKNVIIATADGMIKKSDISEFDIKKRTGVPAITLKGKDKVITVFRTSGNEILFFATRDGKGISFQEKEVRPVGRTASGVRAVTLEKDDEVIAVLSVNKTSSIVTLTKKGYSKIVSMKEFKVQARGGKGVLLCDRRHLKHTEDFVGAFALEEDSIEKGSLIIITDDGIEQTPYTKIPKMKRGDKGEPVSKEDVLKAWQAD